MSVPDKITSDGFNLEYLESKQGLDKASRNLQCAQKFRDHLESLYAQRGSLSIVEMGAGSGGYPATESLPWHVIGSYQLWEPDEALTKYAETRFRNQDLPISVINSSWEDFKAYQAENHRTNKPDVFIANSVIDLFSPEVFFSELLTCLPGNTLVYLSLVFDGGSCFLPPHPSDKMIINEYHQTMTNSSGRRGHETATISTKQLLKAGINFTQLPSPWVVKSLPNSVLSTMQYTTFLNTILSFVGSSLQSRVSEHILSPWMATRMQNRRSGELEFFAEHSDFLFFTPRSLG